MKITAIFMNRDAVEFSLQTNYKFDPEYRTVSVKLTPEQIESLKPKNKELISNIFVETGNDSQ